tara:strand:+ start:502 stop:2265 length:1764 start_codon:yes stop_codon:yes gene_type:complete
MNKFTIIRQKLSVIFIIITFIIAGLVFLNCVYNSLFVWYDNDNDVNLTDEIIPVSSMFGYKILSNSYIVNGICSKYNNDVILTTNINTMSFKIFKMIFTLYVIMMILTYFSQFIAARQVIEVNPFENTFLSEFKDIIILGVLSAFAMLYLSNKYTWWGNSVDKEYKEYDDAEETFESYLFVQYMKITDDDKETLTKIIKNTNKSNFNNEDDYNRIKETKFGSSRDICLKFLKLCKDLCVINKDTNVDVVKVFHKFLLNCQISDSEKNMRRRYNMVKVADDIVDTKIVKKNAKYTAIYIDDISEMYNVSKKDIDKKINNIAESLSPIYDELEEILIIGKNEGKEVYYTIESFKKPAASWLENIFTNYILKYIGYVFSDINCIISELNFLKTNFNSIFELLAKAGRAINPFGGNDEVYYNKKDDETKNMNIVLLTSLLTKDFLKDCKKDKRMHESESYDVYLEKMGEYAIDGIDDNNSFISLMNEAKKSTFNDLFIKGLVTGIIVFAFANIVLKKYYNIYHKELLESIDKDIVLYRIYGDSFNKFKYKTIKTLLNANDYLLNATISLVIIALLLKPLPLISSTDINLKC